ncbi:MAG: hypothetical protein WC455_26530 [Dehalococcoidia bacterium]|jgi:hypothetical protein
MKLREMNGWELMRSLNDEVKVIDGNICEIHDHNRRRAAMQFLQHRVLTEEANPQTGIYFWIPVTKGWRLETFFDSQFPSTRGIDLEHATIWRKWANTMLRKDDSRAPYEVANAYAGLPRGRVTKFITREHPGGPKVRKYLILHGDDYPAKDAAELIASRFGLREGSYKFLYDDHERMNKDDVRTIQNYLGRDLGLLKRAAS